MEEVELRLYEGKPLISSDGERMGTISQTYKDAVSGKVEWLLLDVGFGGERSLVVPAADMEEEVGSPGTELEFAL